MFTGWFCFLDLIYILYIIIIIIIYLLPVIG
jgi:hypothetical protein